MSQRHLFVPFILRPAGTRHYLSTNLSLDFRRHDGSYVRVGGVVFDTAGGFTTLPAGWARHVGIQFETTTASELPVIGVTGKGVAYLNRATFSFPDIPHTHFTSLCAFSPTAPYPLLALGVFGVKAWANVYFTPPSANAMLIQVQSGQFAFYFRYPGPDGKFGPIHADHISEATQNFYGLDTDHDQDSKDDIVTAQMAIPVNREIHLLMHTKDVGHSFFVPELRVQQDFVPGLDLTLHFTATKVGRYEIVCTQLCGLGHYNMKAYLSVLSQQDFDDWLKKQAALQ